MDARKVVRDFYHQFEKMNLEGLLPLFAPHAMVKSPTLGKKEYQSFYRELFSKTKRIKVNIKDIFVNPDMPHRAAAFVDFSWEMKHGEPMMTFDCVVIFEINAEGKIQLIHVIYDAQLAREALRKAG